MPLLWRRAARVTRSLLICARLEWNSLALYPAGYFARQIPVAASLTLPTEWSLATALDTAAA